jgi:hypothetical protein
MKKGRISKEEHAFIEANIKLPVTEIASQLDRNPESVTEYIKKNFGYSEAVTPREVNFYNLTERPFYRELKQQFTNDELEILKYHWDRMVCQFNKDVFATEEMQILDVAKLEILMNRSLKSNKENIEAINALERLLSDYESIVMPAPEEVEMAMNWQRQIGALRGAQDSLNRDYRDLQTKKSSMLKEMKATRDQRIQRLEDSKESFPAWVASLLQDPQKMRSYGIEMEKMRIATEKEKQRLSAFHKYDDGMVDQPFLNSDTVIGD